MTALQALNLHFPWQEFGLTAIFWFFQGIKVLTDWLPKSMFTGRVSGSPACVIAFLLFQFSGSSKRGPCHPHPTPFSEIGSEVNFSLLTSRSTVFPQNSLFSSPRAPCPEHIHGEQLIIIQRTGAQTHSYTHTVSRKTPLSGPFSHAFTLHNLKEHTQIFK